MVKSIQTTFVVSSEDLGTGPKGYTAILEDKDDKEYTARLTHPEFADWAFCFISKTSSEQEILEALKQKIFGSFSVLIDDREPIPSLQDQSELKKDEIFIALDITTQLKLALYEELRKSRMTIRKFAKTVLRKDESVARRMLRFDANTSVKALESALAHFGKSVGVTIHDAPNFPHQG